MTIFEPVRDTEKPFLMPIEDIFSIKGRGTVVTGRVERGKAKINEEVELVGIKATTKTTITKLLKCLERAWRKQSLETT